MKFFRVCALAVLLALVAAGCGGDDETTDSTTDAGTIQVTDVWAREPAPGQPNGAGYATIVNGTDDAVRVTGVRSPLTDRTELHETVTDGDQMQMQARPDGFTIEAGEELVLEPGGAHVMFMGIDAATFGDDGNFSLTFEFDGQPAVETIGEIRAIGGASEDMEDMDHSDMDMDDTDE